MIMIYYFSFYKHNNRLHTVHQYFRSVILCQMQNPYKSLGEFLQLPT